VYVYVCAFVREKKVGRVTHMSQPDVLTYSQPDVQVNAQTDAQTDAETETHRYTHANKL